MGLRDTQNINKLTLSHDEVSILCPYMEMSLYKVMY